MQALVELSRKYRFNLGFEGREAETAVLDGPNFKYRIKIEKSSIIRDEGKAYINILDRMLKLGKVIIRPEEQGRPNITLRGIRDPYSFQGSVLKLIGDVTYKNPNGS